MGALAKALVAPHFDPSSINLDHIKLGKERLGMEFLKYRFLLRNESGLAEYTSVNDIICRRCSISHDALTWLLESETGSSLVSSKDWVKILIQSFQFFHASSCPDCSDCFSNTIKFLERILEHLFSKPHEEKEALRTVRAPWGMDGVNVDFLRVLLVAASGKKGHPFTKWWKKFIEIWPEEPFRYDHDGTSVFYEACGDGDVEFVKAALPKAPPTFSLAEPPCSCDCGKNFLMALVNSMSNAPKGKENNYAEILYTLIKHPSSDLSATLTFSVPIVGDLTGNITDFLKIFAPNVKVALEKNYDDITLPEPLLSVY